MFSNADKYRNAVQGLRFDKMRPGFDSAAALDSLKALAQQSEADTQLERMELGERQQQFLEDESRFQSLPAQQNDAFVNRGMPQEFRRIQEATKPVAKRTAYQSQQKGFGLNTNFGNPQIMGSGDTMGQGDTGLGSTDVKNTAALAALRRLRG